MPMAKKRENGPPSASAISRWENEGGALRKRPTLPKDPVQRAKARADENELDSLRQENGRLRQENERLRRQLDAVREALRRDGKKD